MSNSRRRSFGNETRDRLLEWVYDQAPSERLAAAILHSEGYTGIDPSHPLGGKDGVKDAVCEKDGIRMVVACYFPRGQQSLKDIKKKFGDDAEGIKKNNAKGIVFVTNQELKLGEREELRKLADGSIVEIYHLERLTTLLTNPQNYGTRAEFLEIDMTREEILAYHAYREEEHYKRLDAITERLDRQTKDLIGFATGGDSVAFFQPVQNPHGSTIKDTGKKYLRLHAIALGDYPVFDIRAIVQIRGLLSHALQDERRFQKDVIYPSALGVSLVEGPPELVYEAGEVRQHYFVVNFQTRNKMYFQHLRCVLVDVTDTQMWVYASCLLVDGQFDRSYYVSDIFPDYDPKNPFALFDIPSRC